MNHARVVVDDVPATNGAMHVLDKVAHAAQVRRRPHRGKVGRRSAALWVVLILTFNLYDLFIDCS